MYRFMCIMCICLYHCLKNENKISNEVKHENDVKENYTYRCKLWSRV